MLLEREQFREKNDPAELLRMAFGIFRKLKSELIRRNGRRGECNPVEIADRADDQDDPEIKAIKKEDAERLRKAIEELGEPYRTIFRMKYFSEASTEEIISAVDAILEIQSFRKETSYVGRLSVSLQCFNLQCCS